MNGEKLESELKTRVTPSVKQKIEAIANGRHLVRADIVREALREYLERLESQSPADKQHHEEAVSA